MPWSSRCFQNKIPVKDAYYQLINNNVLSLSKMALEDASDIEKEIYRIYRNSEAAILESLARADERCMQP